MKDSREHGCAHALAVSALPRLPPAHERFVLQRVIAYAEERSHAVPGKLRRAEGRGRFHLHSVAAKSEDFIDAGKLGEDRINAEVARHMEAHALFPRDAFRGSDEPRVKRCVRVCPHPEGIVLRERAGKQIAACAVATDGRFRHDDIAKAHGGVQRAHRADE